eukprot:1039925-Prymnesium_polylepis.1
MSRNVLWFLPTLEIIGQSHDSWIMRDRERSASCWFGFGTTGMYMHPICLTSRSRGWDGI